MDFDDILDTAFYRRGQDPVLLSYGEPPDRSFLRHILRDMQIAPLDDRVVPLDVQLRTHAGLHTVVVATTDIIFPCDLASTEITNFVDLVTTTEDVGITHDVYVMSWNAWLTAHNRLFKSIRHGLGPSLYHIDDADCDIPVKTGQRYAATYFSQLPILPLAPSD